MYDSTSMLWYQMPPGQHKQLLFCWADNEYRQQLQPCVITLIAAG